LNQPFESRDWNGEPQKKFRADRTGLPAENLAEIIAPLKLNIAVRKLFT
jgi:hypothetical protein